jgi:hypothetical protein
VIRSLPEAVPTPPLAFGRDPVTARAPDTRRTHGIADCYDPLALARSSQARPGHSLFVRGDCPLGEARHAELVRGGARLLEELAALG